MSSGSILDAIRNQTTLEQPPPGQLLFECTLVAEHDAASRARDAARAANDIEGAQYWAQRANDIAREIARRC